MGCWTVGHNLAGYLPESDVLAFAEWQDAADAYRDMVTRYADEDDDWAADLEPRAEPSMLAYVAGELASAPLTEDQPTGLIAEDCRGRSISFWLQWSDEDPPEDNDWTA